MDKKQGSCVAVPREDGRIIGGRDCEPHSRPYMASLNYGYHFCGGVLINRQWVLSVAHCWYNPYAMQIMLGEHDVRVFEGTEQLMKTDTIIWHPSYDYQTLDYDIMLIKLFHPVEVTEAVAPVQLPRGCPVAGLPCSVSGWGNTAMGDEVFLPYRLQCLDVPIIDEQACENAYPGMISPRMVCAGYMDGGRDACNVSFIVNVSKGLLGSKLCMCRRINHCLPTLCLSGRLWQPSGVSWRSPRPGVMGYGMCPA
ncbi:trypsin-like isoform X3 [Seriola aureovittata]|uniref:trypsin-like isoform X3 n=1 Tax=Seriola aureovittata TaxID=2871759 RepID=UPI0024BDFAA0|nr:trypsin-like isoform X3 [Seriola aureovittata]